MSTTRTYKDMRTIFKPRAYAALMAALLLLAGIVNTSCTNDEFITPEKAPGELITIVATLGSDANKPGTRIDFEDYEDQGKAGLKTFWTEGDQFRIVGTALDVIENRSSVFTLKEGFAGQAIGYFTGTLPEIRYPYALYPATITNMSEFWSHSYSDQTQTGNNNKDHFKGKYSFYSKVQSFQEIKFDYNDREAFYQSSCMKFDLALPADMRKPTMITLATTDGSKRFWMTNKDSYDGGDTASLSLSLKDITLKEGENLTAYLVMSCKNVSLYNNITDEDIKLRIAVTDGEKEYTKFIQFKEVLKGGKTHTIALSKADTWLKSSELYDNNTQASTTLSTANGTDTNAGEAANPYLISSAEDLKLLQDVTNGIIDNATYKGKCYLLTTDITFAPGTDSWKPIGKTKSYSFSGTFDGGGHSVKGLCIDADLQHIGFFGYIYEGTVKNLHIKNGNIKSTYETSGSVHAYVGGVVGYFYTGYVIGCSFSGSVEAAGRLSYIGGICGDGNVIGCYNTGTVKCFHDATIKVRYSSGGGIVGRARYIIGCYNEGTVTGTAPEALDAASLGGIAGYSDKKIIGCYNTGCITKSTVAVGGAIVGDSDTGCKTSGCLWEQAYGSVIVGSNETADRNVTDGIIEIKYPAWINSEPSVKIMNDAIDAGNASVGTSNPLYCPYKFVVGESDPVLVSTQQP